MITKHQKLIAILSLALILFSGKGLMAGTHGTPERPNIIFIFVDDMGYADIGVFGNPVMKTPHMDRMAHEGMRLTNFYVNSPICSPARVGAITGQYPQRWRIHSFLAWHERNVARKMPDWLDPQAPTVARTLLNRGYRTAHFGKWHIGGGFDTPDAPLPQAYGYEESLVSFEGLGDRVLWSREGMQEFTWEFGRGEIQEVEKNQTTEIYVDRAINFMKRHRDEPFYIQVFTNDVHDPFMPSDEHLERWKDAPGSDEDRKFFAVLDNLDRQVGRLVQAVDDLGLGERTLIVLTSDNGPTDWPRYYQEGIDPPGYTGPFFGRKWSLFEGGIRMPFIARWTGTIPPGTVDEKSIVAAFDLFPSFASLAGAKIYREEDIDGQDMSSVLLGNPKIREGMLFWEYGVLGSIRPGKPEHRSPRLAARYGKWKLLCNVNRTMVQLYNLDEDPGEQNNIADQHPEIVNRMKPAVLAWWDEMFRYYDGY